jgi:hypothetical protein
LPGVGRVKLPYFALLLAVCLAPTQEKSVAENSVEASIRHVTVINVGNSGIHNSTQIQAVWLQGKYFDQAALAQLLETAKAAAKH